MPVIDMPLEELKKYQGINPRPSDFEAYWDRSLLELSQQPLNYELIPDAFSAPGVECYHLYFTGVEGARIHSKFVKPSKDSSYLAENKKVAAVAWFHGYRGHCGDWFEKIAYAQSGMCLAALDARGQSGLSEDTLTVNGSTFYGHITRGIDEENPEKLLFRRVFLDTVQLVRILMSMDFIDENRIGTGGFSQGGALTLACAALEPRIKIAAAGYPFLCDFKRVWQMDLCKDAYEEIKTYFRLRDPLHSNEDRFWEKLGYIDLQYLVHRIRAKTTFFTGLMDTVCPPSTQFAAYNKITAEKNMILYPDFAHEALPHSYDTIFQLMRTQL